MHSISCQLAHAKLSIEKCKILIHSFSQSVSQFPVCSFYRFVFFLFFFVILFQFNTQKKNMRFSKFKHGKLKISLNVYNAINKWVRFLLYIVFSLMIELYIKLKHVFVQLNRLCSVFLYVI